MGKPGFPIPLRAGCALPNPPRGRGLGARASGPRPLRYGETRFPHTPRRGLIFTLALHAAPPHNAAMKIRLFLGGRSPPRPSRGWGHGETGFPHPLRGGGVGKPGFPTPSSRTYVHVRPPCMRLAPHPDGMNIRLFLGWLRPPRPSHRVGGWGNRVSPHPCVWAAPSQTLPRAGVWGNRVPPCSRQVRLNHAYGAAVAD